VLRCVTRRPCKQASASRHESIAAAARSSACRQKRLKLQGRDVRCHNAAETIEAVLAHGGSLVQPIGGDAPEITARGSRVPRKCPSAFYQQPAR
jgi:hypothetical protein